MKHEIQLKKIEVRTIGPTEAERLLATTDMGDTLPLNRRLNTKIVAQYAEAMTKGNWRELMDAPIAVDRDGRLRQGQHRLAAVINSGKSIRFYFITGIDEQDFAVLDTGRTRSLSDVLHVRGEKYASPMATALGNLYGFRTKGVIGYATNGLTNPNGLELLEKNAGLRDSVASTAQLAKDLGGGHGRWACLHYVLNSIDHDDASTFFEKLQTGANLAQDDPIFHLRARVLADRNTLRRMSRVMFTALVLKTWNLYRDGARTTFLRWVGGGSHPEEYPVPR